MTTNDTPTIVGDITPVDLLYVIWQSGPEAARRLVRAKFAPLPENPGRFAPTETNIDTETT